MDGVHQIQIMDQRDYPPDQCIGSGILIIKIIFKQVTGWHPCDTVSRSNTDQVKPFQIYDIL